MDICVEIWFKNCQSGNFGFLLIVDLIKMKRFFLANAVREYLSDVLVCLGNVVEKFSLGILSHAGNLTIFVEQKKNDKNTHKTIHLDMNRHKFGICFMISSQHLILQLISMFRQNAYLPILKSLLR